MCSSHLVAPASSPVTTGTSMFSLCPRQLSSVVSRRFYAPAERSLRLASVGCFSGRGEFFAFKPIFHAHRVLHHISNDGPSWPRHNSGNAGSRGSGRRAAVEDRPRQSERAQSVINQHATTAAEASKREQWQIQKAALETKFGEDGWRPRKKLPPDALEEIRTLHAQEPTKNSTAALAAQYQVSPEAIRRILKSKWRPTEQEHEGRLRRWDRRGERIWTGLAQAGFQPPKKWRQKGIKRARNPGADPGWPASPEGPRPGDFQKSLETYQQALEVSSSLASRII